MHSPYLRRRPVENLVLVRERDRRRARELARLLFGLLPLAAALLSYTWVHTEILQAGYSVRSLEDRLEVLDRSERRLRLEIAFLSSPQRVEAAAASDLGMVFPTLEQMVFVDQR